MIRKEFVCFYCDYKWADVPWRYVDNKKCPQCNDSRIYEQEFDSNIYGYEVDKNKKP